MSDKALSHKGYLLATAGGVVAAAGGAQAADLAARGPAVLPPPATWAGWYIGVNAGAHWQQATNQNGFLIESSATTKTASTDKSGFIGGGQIGYNWQSGNFVYGIEADIQGLSGTADTKEFDGKGKHFENKINWLSTIRGRAGLAVGDTMAYMTGGIAIGGVKNSWVAGPTRDPKSVSTTRVGWTIGGGVEHMMTRNWTFGVEALFVDLGHSNAPSSIGNAQHSAEFSNHDVIGRAKLNYKW